MIIVQLTGGLGNQLFQYAAGKTLALHHNTAVKVDVSHYQQNKDRKLDLNQLTIPVTIANQEEISEFINTGLISKALARLQPAHARKVYREPSFRYDPSFLDARSHVYLKGYWQSEKYFDRYRSEIFNEFKVRQELVNKVSDFAAKLQSEISVSVHIRRGDFLNTIALDHHGILDGDYYKRAIKLFPANAKFYFFSDDIDWVKSQQLTDKPYEFVSGVLTSSAIEDFYLMSQCHHNIIANSSFSWWAAWLNDNPNKTVIAPGKWFNKAGHDTSDLIPPGWQRI